MPTFKIHECMHKLSHASETSVSVDITPYMPSLVCFLVFSAAGRSLVRLDAPCYAGSIVMS